MRLKSILLFVFCLPFIGNAQSVTPEVIATAGDHYQVGNVALSWTIGEPMTETFAAGPTVITQGFHQPDYRPVGIDENVDPLADFTVFPNPAGDEINISWENLQGISEFDVLIIDMAGKTVLQSKVSTASGNTKLDIKDIAAGQYGMQFRNHGTSISKGYRIQKVK